MTDNVEFRNLLKKLDPTSSESEKERIIQELLLLNPKFPGLSSQKKKFRNMLETLQKKKNSSKRISSKSLYEFPSYKLRSMIIGTPNTGKSTLLNKFSDAEAVVEDYPYSTFKPELGMMQYQDVSIQLVELPPIFSGDYQTNGQKYELIKRSRSASIMIRSEEDLEVVLDELTNANIPIASYQDKNVEGLPSFVIYRDMELFDIGIPFVHADEIQDVKDAFYNSLGIIRVYSQEDKNSEPFILEKNKSRVCDMAKQISSGYKYAKVWGESVKHAGQKVDMQHVLKEGDKVHLCRC